MRTAGHGAVGGDVAEHQRVAVRRRLGHGLRRDHAAAAGDVLDDERLAQGAAELLGDGAGDEVHAAARLHGGDDLHGLGRVVLRGREAGEQRGEREEGAGRAVHGVVS